MAASRLSPFKNWVADGFSDFCTNCQDKFTLLNRKHHCRSCGRLLCSPCASNWCLVPCDMMVVNPLRNDDSTVPQRCCAPCAKILVDQQSDLRELLSKSHTELKFERETALRYMNLPISFNLESDIKKATYTLYNFTSDNLMEGPDKIPKELISSAKGIAFFTILKAGFLFSGRIGTGLVISRLADGNWSAPSSVLLSGMGWGFQFGGELTDVILILTTDKAVETFTSSSQVSVGTELGVAAGPVGRSAGTDVHGSKKGAAAAFSYAHSKGLFAGISLEASVIVSRPDINRKFYGMEVEPAHLLSGKIPAPKCADPLYRALSEVLTKVEGENEIVGIGESLSNFLVGRVGGEQKSDDKFDEWTKERDERLRSSFLQEKESFGPVNSRVRLDNSPYRRRNQSESPPLSSESVYDLQHDYSFDSSSSFILSNCPYSKRMDNNVFELKEISVMNESNSDESNADESASKQSPRQLPAKSYFYDQDDISVDELDEVFRPSNYYEKAGHIRNKTCHENLYEEIRF